MKNGMLESVVSCMAASNNGTSTIQKVQTEHRIKLAEFWDIKEGSKVLEIGCGQGDTTAVLAYLVGEEGLVQGVDIASPNYGSPITLGDSANYLKKSRLGKQIKIDFEIDILSPQVEFPENYFDTIVLSHCSWYLKSFEELTKIMEKVRKWGKKLCFAEWDTRIKTIEQFPHFLAILIQSQYECFKENSLSNVRTLFTPNDVKKIVGNAGWNILNDKSIISSELQDGKWELDITLSDYQFELDEMNDIPTKLKSLIQSELNLLEESFNNMKDVKSMSTYTFIAEKV
jgi:SAM-dependent methyltransferase